MSTLPDSITINVTQENIDLGKRNSCHEDPVALAITEALRKAGFVEFQVDVAGDIRVEYFGRKTYSLPAEADTFITNFDSGAEVQPLSFVATKI